MVSPYLPRTVLVTGGAGFIGSHIVDDLVASGVRVTVLDNLEPSAHAGQPAYLNPAARYVWGDCRDRAAWDEAIGDGPVDAVCHQAGKVGLGVDFGDVTSYVDHNDTGFAVGLLALHQARFEGIVVLASSMVVYGEGGYRCELHGPVRPGPRGLEDLEAGRFEPHCPRCTSPLRPEAVTEDAALDPRNVYAATKLHQEHLLFAYAREHPAVRCVALRYHNVYGPRMPQQTPYAGVASLFRSALEAGEAPRVTEDGRQLRDFVHVRDVAAVNVAALVEATMSGAYNVASGDPRSVGEMAEALARAFGVRPGDSAWPVVTGGFRRGDVRHVFASVERLRAGIGYRTSVCFADGMASFARAPLRAPA